MRIAGEIIAERQSGALLTLQLAKPIEIGA